MKTLSTDENNDLLIQGGKFVFKSDAEAISELSRHNVLTNYGELVFNALWGVRYFDYVFNDVLDLDNFRRNAIEEIMRIDGVLSVPMFIANVKEGVLYYTAVVETIYGQVNLNA